MKHNISIESLGMKKDSIWKCKAKLSHCEIWENTQCQLIAEAYPMWNGNGNRSHNSLRLPFVVECLGTIGIDEKYLLLQRIPNRLSEVYLINETQSLKILYAIFKAMSCLEPIFGFFTLTQSCICFNQCGQVKIWIHPNLSLVRPLKIYPPQHNLTNKIISTTILMVEEKCLNPMLLYGLKKKIEERHNFHFEAAAEYVRCLAESLFLDLREFKDPASDFQQNLKHSKKNSTSNAFVRKESASKRAFPTQNNHESQLYGGGSGGNRVPNLPKEKEHERRHHKRNKSSVDSASQDMFKKSYEAGKISSDIFCGSEANRQGAQKTNFGGTNLTNFSGFSNNTLQSPRNFDKNDLIIRKKSEEPVDYFQKGKLVEEKYGFKNEGEYLNILDDKEEVKQKQVEDSFSKGLPLSHMETKKEFHTFGHLEPSSSNSHKMSSKNTNGELDIAEMDANIQKKLSMKSAGRKEVRISQLEEEEDGKVNEKGGGYSQKDKENRDEFWQHEKHRTIGITDKYCPVDQKYGDRGANNGEFTASEALEHNWKSRSIYQAIKTEQANPDTKVTRLGTRHFRNTTNECQNNINYNFDSKPYQTRR